MGFSEQAKTWDEDPKRRERAETVAAAILREVPFSQPMTGFEYGCGTGLLSFALQSRLKKIILADNAEGMLQVVREKIALTGYSHMQPVLLDLSAGALLQTHPKEQFSLLYTLMTLHHIPDTVLILKHFYTLLEKGGYLCIADLDLEDGSFHGEEEGVHHGFDRDALAVLAEKAGFSGIRFSTVFTMERGEEKRSFPVFLMVAKKE